MRLFHSATIFLLLHMYMYLLFETSPGWRGFFNSIWWGPLSSNVFTICAVYWSLVYLSIEWSVSWTRWVTHYTFGCAFKIIMTKTQIICGNSYDSMTGFMFELTNSYEVHILNRHHEINIMRVFHACYPCSIPCEPRKRLTANRSVILHRYHLTISFWNILIMIFFNSSTTRPCFKKVVQARQQRKY